MKTPIATFAFATLAFLSGVSPLMASEDEDVVYTLTLNTEVPEPGQFTIELGMQEEDADLLMNRKERSRKVSRMIKAQETRSFLRPGPAEAASEADTAEDESELESEAGLGGLPPVPAGIPGIPVAAANEPERPGEHNPFKYPDRPFGTLSDAARAGIDPFASGTEELTESTDFAHEEANSDTPEKTPEEEGKPLVGELSLVSQAPVPEKTPVFDWKNPESYKDAFESFFSDFEMRIAGILALGVLLAWFFSRTRRKG